jgi:murein DD-endopeptidase MepM/ murein hydrolase activator NlpD
MPRKAAITVAVLVAALVAAPAALASPSANTAALQVALRALHRYHGVVDGIAGPKTKRGLKAFQRAHHLVADGIAGPKTRRALGRRGRPALGSRIMHKGQRGWDVAGLQFLLRRRGFSPRTIDGGFGPRTLGALERFQRAAHIGVDGRAGRQTLRALRHRSIRRRGGHSSHTGRPTGPVRFLRPVPGPIGDGFGYPGGRRHDGVDFPEPYGTPIGAAGVGTVTFAGWNSGGYGNLTVIQHRIGYQTRYAHQSKILVSVGEHVAGGVKIGRVGSTGHATGPHLHFEVRVRGAAVDPLRTLP